MHESGSLLGAKVAGLVGYSGMVEEVASRLRVSLSDCLRLMERGHSGGLVKSSRSWDLT